VQEVFGFVERNLSAAKRRKDGRDEDGGAGQGAAVPRLSTQQQERDQRSDPGMELASKRPAALIRSRSLVGVIDKEHVDGSFHWHQSQSELFL
jgi:hypothetical protein